MGASPQTSVKTASATLPQPRIGEPTVDPRAGIKERNGEAVGRERPWEGALVAYEVITLSLNHFDRQERVADVEMRPPVGSVGRGPPLVAACEMRS